MAGSKVGAFLTRGVEWLKDNPNNKSGPDTYAQEFVEGLLSDNTEADFNGLTREELIAKLQELKRGNDCLCRENTTLNEIVSEITSVFNPPSDQDTQQELKKLKYEFEALAGELEATRNRGKEDAKLIDRMERHNASLVEENSKLIKLLDEQLQNEELRNKRQPAVGRFTDEDILAHTDKNSELELQLIQFQEAIKIWKNHSQNLKQDNDKLGKQLEIAKESIRYLEESGSGGQLRTMQQLLDEKRDEVVRLQNELEQYKSNDSWVTIEKAEAEETVPVSALNELRVKYEKQLKDTDELRLQYIQLVSALEMQAEEGNPEPGIDQANSSDSESSYGNATFGIFSFSPESEAALSQELKALGLEDSEDL